MHSPYLATLAAALLLTLTGPVPVHAADISLHTSVYDLVDVNNPNIEFLTIEEIDVWARVRGGFGIPDLENALVATQTKWYAARPDYFQRTTTRASRYLFHVVQELEKRGMPTELALLPFIESAFNPHAYSSAKAAGMWQFIPSTGRDFNLKQNFFKDERRDVLASTDAALTYLQKLHGMFGDWHLALAAYNWGEGSVQRAIKKNQAAGLPTDFNGLSRLMPAETRNYVPKLQAVKNIIAMPEQYDIALPEVDNQPYFVTINKMQDIDIKVAAKLAELPEEEFKALNPQFNRPVIPGGTETQILLPEDNAEKFKTNVANWTKSFSSWSAHTVRSARERIETIAARFNTTPEVIREVNGIPPRMQIVKGSTILVPRAEGADEDIAQELVDTAKLAMAPDRPATRRVTVKVGKRDSLSSIARRYRVSVADIKDWNDLRGDILKRGQNLRLNVPAVLAKAKTTGSQRKARGSNRYERKATASSKRRVQSSATKTKKSTAKIARKKAAIEVAKK
jgi:membrane-bound lytic murein transglycosylase D